MPRVSPQAIDAIYLTVEGLHPVRETTHQLGCHRRGADDRLVLRALLHRVVTG